jgi:hypothetical protein
MRRRLGASCKEVTAWNKGDAQAYSQHFAADGTFTNVRGMFFTGHQAFLDRHEEIFKGMFRGTVLRQDVVRSRPPNGSRKHLNRRFCITLCPQEMNTFSEHCNAGLLSLRSVCRSHDEITKEVQISNGIKHSIDHECRERVGSIYRDVSSLLNRNTDIQAVCLQS